MPTTPDSQAVVQYREEVQISRILAVMNFQINEGLTVEKACERASVPTRTFYSWLNSEVFAEYLTEMRRSRQTLAASQAAGALPDVIQYMIGLATGTNEARGASPVAAAKLLIEIADRYAGPEVPRDRKAPTTYIPQQVAVLIQSGAPVTDDGGHIIIDMAPNKED